MVCQVNLYPDPSSILQICYRVGEKYLDWVDDALPSTTILEFASLYWLTETFPRAIYPYREVRAYCRER